jgi:hypothetical protein
MSIIEVILVVSLVIHVFSIIILFLNFMSLMTMKVQIQQMHVGLATTLGKLFTIEQLMAKIGNGFTEFVGLAENMMDGPSNRVVYKTADGKYTAQTVDDLIEKIKKDGKSDEYFSDEELDKLKKMFDPEDDTNDDEED